MSNNLRKINALERQFDIVIILNNNPKIVNKLYTLKGKLHESSQNVRPSSSPYKSPQITLSNSQLIKKQLTELNKDNKFIIKNNKNKYTEKDIFRELLDYNTKTEFCGLLNHFLAGEMYYCDFVIILNDTLFDDYHDSKRYNPLCMAIVKLVPNKVTKRNNLYIDGICSNLETYNCGSYLINLLKYISAKAFDCSEIRVDSIPDAKKFYKKQKFITRPNMTDEEGYSVLDYNLYYEIVGNEKYIPPPNIEGIPQVMTSAILNILNKTYPEKSSHSFKKSNKKKELTRDELTRKSFIKNNKTIKKAKSI